MLRFLEPIAMGWWNASQLLRVPLDLLRAGILSGMNREYPHLVGAGRTEEARQVLETGLAYTLAIIAVSQLVLGGMLLAAGRENPMLVWGLVTTTLVWALGVYAHYVRSMLRTSRQFMLVGRVGVIVAILDAALVVLVWRFGFAGLAARAMISATATFVLFYRQRDAATRPRMDWAVLRRLFAFGRHHYLTGFGLLLGAQAERLMLLSVSGGVEWLGLYTPALAAATLLQVVPGSMQGFHYPKIMEEFGRNGDERLLLKATMTLIRRTFFAMILVSAAMAMGFVLLVELFLPRYVGGLPAALITCAAGPFLAARVGVTYFSALRRWPEYYFYTGLQCGLPFGLIWLALRWLPPLPAVALGGGLAIAVSGVALVALVVMHGRKRSCLPPSPS
ncbi:MAG: hypothetical protein JNK23_11490 [Opitutaceae bacterium]|nr:hypothetical protein [Opitutaceae bacterium]